MRDIARPVTERRCAEDDYVFTAKFNVSRIQGAFAGINRERNPKSTKQGDAVRAHSLTGQCETGVLTPIPARSPGPEFAAGTCGLNTPSIEKHLPEPTGRRARLRCPVRTKTAEPPPATRDRHRPAIRSPPGEGVPARRSIGQKLRDRVTDPPYPVLPLPAVA